MASGAVSKAVVIESDGTDAKNDTLIINAAECEPFITVDYRECLEHGDDILEGVNAVAKYLNIKSVIIAVENNKPKAIEILRDIANTDNDSGARVKIGC